MTQNLMIFFKKNIPKNQSKAKLAEIKSLLETVNKTVKSIDPDVKPDDNVIEKLNQSFERIEAKLNALSLGTTGATSTESKSSASDQLPNDSNIIPRLDSIETVLKKLEENNRKPAQYDFVYLVFSTFICSTISLGLLLILLMKQLDKSKLAEVKKTPDVDSENKTSELSEINKSINSLKDEFKNLAESNNSFQSSVITKEERDSWKTSIDEISQMREPLQNLKDIKELLSSTISDVNKKIEGLSQREQELTSQQKKLADKISEFLNKKPDEKSKELSIQLDDLLPKIEELQKALETVETLPSQLETRVSDIMKKLQPEQKDLLSLLRDLPSQIMAKLQPGSDHNQNSSNQNENSLPDDVQPTQQYDRDKEKDLTDSPGETLNDEDSQRDRDEKLNSLADQSQPDENNLNNEEDDRHTEVTDLNNIDKAEEEEQDEPEGYNRVQETNPNPPPADNYKRSSEVIAPEVIECVKTFNESSEEFFKKSEYSVVYVKCSNFSEARNNGVTPILGTKEADDARYVVVSLHRDSSIVVLFPKKSKIGKETEYNTMELLFNCQKYTRGFSKFTLIKPAKVSKFGSNQWKLIEKGQLEFTS
ncbi:hypothetical protein [Planktothricoides raciborskii]|uniref:Uncharacterized protein n=1 Tax=Planktothricoides raciborskii GIHE-MW2 TaxID=2792601 RepID=A0AAU8JF91_9CYAN